MTGSHRSLARPAAFALATLLLAATTGVAFSAWLEQAPAMFMVLVEQGLALCF